MTRVIGPPRSRRRRWTFLSCLAFALTVGALYVGGAQAVHETGIFQMDGNAQSTVQNAAFPPAREDWDQICSALLTTLTPAGTCEKSPSYNLPTYGALAAAIDDSQTSITVTENGSLSPPAVPFIIRIDSEEMRVTARTPGSPATYTVVRGYNSAAGSSPLGGPAAGHANGATVFAITIASPASFVVDPSEANTDDILKGGTKDDNPVASWGWASAKPSPPKNDITHAFAAEYTCGGTANNSVPGCGGTHAGHKILYFGGDRFSNSGSANLAFWFFQQKVQQLQANGTPVGTPGTDTCSLSSGCNFSGEHVARDLATGQRGDILIISAFGPHAQIQVFEWVGVGNAPAPCFTNACSLVPLIPASAGQECGVSTTDDACAVVNTGGEPSPWTLSQKNAPANTFDATNFFEGGIDLNNLGLGSACFSSFLMNTRASAAGDAELHDKTMGQFQRCAPALTTQASQNGTVTPGTPVTDTATVTVSGAANPADATGTITFFLCPFATRTTCTTQIGSPVTLQPGANANDGVSTATSLSVNDSGQAGDRGPLLPGQYCFRAKATLTNYDSPDEFTNADTECFTVAKLPSTTATTSSPTGGGVVPGTSVTDTATVSGSGPTPTGTVHFFLCQPNEVTAGGCEGTAGTEVGTGKTLVNGSATSDATTNTNAIGKYCWRVEYGGDNIYSPSSHTDASGECFTTVKQPSTTATTSNPTGGGVVPGTSVTDTATVSGSGPTPTGTVHFFLCQPNEVTAGGCEGTAGTEVGTGKTLVNGSATSDATTNTNAIGKYCWRAEYSGDGFYDPSSHTDASGECFTTVKQPSSTATTSNPTGDTTPGASVTDTATVSGSGPTPTGTVHFFLCQPNEVTAGGCEGTAGTEVGSGKTLVNGSATSDATTNTNALGKYCWRAEYSGDGFYDPSSHTDATGECFTVKTTSSGTSDQNWLPNDHVVVSTPTGTLDGRLEIQLLKGTLTPGDCAGSTGVVKYTEPVPNSGAFQATAAGAEYTTTNTSFKVATADAGDYFWRIVFTPGTFTGVPPVFTPNPFATGFTKCETSTVTINDNP